MPPVSPTTALRAGCSARSVCVASGCGGRGMKRIGNVMPRAETCASPLAKPDPEGEARGLALSEQAAKQSKLRKKPAVFRWHRSLEAFLDQPQESRGRLSAPQICVLWALVRYADAKGRCFPKQNRLSNFTGLSRRAVQNSLRQLEQAGLISIDDRGGRGQANVYDLRFSDAE